MKFPVYGPTLPLLLAFTFTAPAFADGKISDLVFKDSRLADCVQDWAKEEINLYENVSQLHELPCSGYGIESLEGIEALSDLMVIDLGGNPLVDFSPLYALADELRLLWLGGSELSCETIAELRRQLPRALIAGMDTSSCLE